MDKENGLINEDKEFFYEKIGEFLSTVYPACNMVDSNGVIVADNGAQSVSGNDESPKNEFTPQKNIKNQVVSDADETMSNAFNGLKIEGSILSNNFSVISRYWEANRSLFFKKKASYIEV